MSRKEELYTTEECMRLMRAKLSMIRYLLEGNAVKEALKVSQTIDLSRWQSEIELLQRAGLSLHWPNKMQQMNEDRGITIQSEPVLV